MTDRSPVQRPVVVHFAERFLAVTENWIYHQVVRACRYRPVVATEAREKKTERFTGAPHLAPRRRLDETAAARKPVLRWKPDPVKAAAE